MRGGRFSISSTADRQYRDVFDRFHNADGTPKEGWLKAPNGRPTNLTERQWVQVRTENFKRWFGDWETREKLKADTGVLTPKLAKERLYKDKGSKITNIQTGEHAQFGSKQINKMISGKARDKSISAGFTAAEHYAAVSHVKEFFEESLLIGAYQDRNSDPNIKSIKRYISPAIIGDKECAVLLTVKESVEAGNRIYSIEGLELENVENKIKELRGTINALQTQQRFPLSSGNIVSKILEKVNTSKVVDENGEPKVVYHGSEHGDFWTFDRDLIRAENAFFFTDNKALAEEYSVDDYLEEGEVGTEKVFEVFLNIRNPSIKDFEGKRYLEKSDEVEDGIYAARDNGNDALILRNIVDPRFSESKNMIPVTDYAVFDPNQIKSATDNTGAFGRQEDDTRYSITTPEQREKIDAISAARAAGGARWWDRLPFVAEAQAKIGKPGPGTFAIDTPERHEMRARIAEELYGQHHADQGRQLHIVMGLPGSGKSAVVVKKIQANVNAVLIDADDVKPLLPEYDGGAGASTVHEESSFIAEEMIMDARARENGDNVIFPTVGKTYKKLHNIIEKFKNSGYTVYLYNVRVSLDTSIERALVRFVTTDRFVSPEYISGVGLKPQQNFDKLVSDKEVDYYGEWSNEVRRGAPPEDLGGNIPGGTLAGGGGDLSVRGERMPGVGLDGSPRGDGKTPGTETDPYGSQSLGGRPYDRIGEGGETQEPPSGKPRLGRHSLVTDPDLLRELNSGETVKVYRAMQVIDGKLYSPMAAKVDGKLTDPIQLGKWERSDERPELARADNKFLLDKANGTRGWAAYNPYIHTSRSPLNDPFSSAYARPNIVIVETEIPASELTSGYKAYKAKDPVGEMAWHSGPVAKNLAGTPYERKVILTRYDRPLRILKDSEVADLVADTIIKSGITVPANVVTPGLREELIKRGVPVGGVSGLRNVPKELERFVSTDGDRAHNEAQLAKDAEELSGAEERLSAPYEPSDLQQLKKDVQTVAEGGLKRYSVSSMLQGSGVTWQERKDGSVVLFHPGTGRPVTAKDPLLASELAGMKTAMGRMVYMARKYSLNADKLDGLLDIYAQILNKAVEYIGTSADGIAQLDAIWKWASSFVFKSVKPNGDELTTTT